MMDDATAPDNHPVTGPIARLAQRVTGGFERWMPDAFVFALAATLLCVLAAYAVDPNVRADPTLVVMAWGNGFWELARFTLQMSMIIVGGFVLASSSPAGRLIGRLAAIPGNGRSAVLAVALVAMLSSLLNWGFSLVFSALYAKAVARRRPDADYRALAAASFLGLGTVWAQGLSGSAALQIASETSMPKVLFALVGTIPLSETIFRWQSVACVVIEIVVVAALVWVVAPVGERAKNAAQLGVELGEEGTGRAGVSAERPGEVLENRPWLLLPVVALGFGYLGVNAARRADSLVGALNTLDVNTVNLVLLMLGALLHWTPASLMRAVRDATPAVWGVLLQFPFYAGIAGVMTGTALSKTMAGWFVGVSNATIFPAMVVAYSALLGIFVPSGGSKWVIEAPYVLTAAKELGVSAGWMVVTYDLGEAIANLVQPFWMLPILALLGLRARDVMGHTFLVALVLFPLVCGLVTVFRP